MRKITSVYLAGPEASYPDAANHAAAQRATCEIAGFVGLSPADLVSTSGGTEVAARDTGSAFEAGFMAALGKPVFGFLNVSDEMEAEYRDRVEDLVGAQLDEHGHWLDADGCLIEDYGLPETLMLWAEARRLYVIVTEDPLGDLTGLQLCLEALRLYAD